MYSSKRDEASKRDEDGVRTRTTVTSTARSGATSLKERLRLRGRGSGDGPSGAPTTSAAATGPVVEARAGAKNRPTPSRREAEAARRRPLVPADRKAATQESRVRQREQRTKMRAAMMAGEEWALPARDRGAQRAFIRDHVDARWNVGEFLLPIMVIGLPVSLIPDAVAIGYGIVYGTLFVAVLDTALLWFGLKRRIRAKFGAAPERGSLWYVISRVMQMRIGRVPRPRVKRGQYPS